MDEDPKVPVYAEAELKPQSRAPLGEVRERVALLLKSGIAMFEDGPVAFEQDDFLGKHLQALRISDIALCKNVCPEPSPPLDKHGRAHRP
jgi:hypothetical protein